MEVAGLVFGIVGLYSACQECYDLFCDVKNADAHTALAAREFDIHGSILKAWAFYWEIKLLVSPTNAAEDAGAAPGDDNRILNSPKLSKYLDRNPCKAVGIATALLCIGDLLSDKQKLFDHYGLEVNFEECTGAVDNSAQSTSTWRQLVVDVKEKTRLIYSRTNLKRKIAWALKDHAKFNVLIAGLKRHNDSLHLLGPEWASEMLNIRLALEYLPRQDDSAVNQLQHMARNETLRGRSDTGNNKSIEAGHETENGDVTILGSVSPTQQGLQLLFDLAKLKAEAAHSANEAFLDPAEERKLVSFKKTDFDFGKSGMAVWFQGKETVFIERHSYETPNSDLILSRKIRTNILKLGRLLQLPVCRMHLCALELLGLVEFPDRKKIGFVYRLPDSLGKRRPGFPIYDMDIRRPMGLLKMTRRRRDAAPPLGLRFELARKLVQSVAFLHASGWLHKNIRTDELVFFPKDNEFISRKPKGMNLEQPFLIGPLEDVAQSHRGQDGNPDYFKLPDQATGTPAPRTRTDERGNVSFIPREVENIFQIDESASSSSTSFEADVIEVSRSGTQRSREAFRANLDHCHHPYKILRPGRRYCHAFEVYSLGIALVEIGLWEGIRSDRDSYETRSSRRADPFEDSRLTREFAQRELTSICGEIYSKVALACLNVDPEGERDGDEGAGLVAQRELCARIAADLAQCRA